MHFGLLALWFSTSEIKFIKFESHSCSYMDLSECYTKEEESPKFSENKYPAFSEVKRNIRFVNDECS